MSLSLLMRMNFGAHEDDARLIRLKELRRKAEDVRKSKNGGLTAGKVDEYRSLTHELVMEQVERLKQGPPRAVLIRKASVERHCAKWQKMPVLMRTIHYWYGL